MSVETKTAHCEVAWREITRIRVILAHAYFDIEQDVVGNVVADDVPCLREQLLVMVVAPPADDDRSV